jgi:type IV secretion system protein VirD4
MLRLSIISALLLSAAAGVCLGQGIDAPESQSEADAKGSAQDQVYNDYLKQQLNKGLVSREDFQKQFDYHAGWIARRRAKWINTPYLAIYDKAFKRALTDSAYRRPLPDDPSPPVQQKTPEEDSPHGLFWWVGVFIVAIVAGMFLYAVITGKGPTPKPEEDDRPPLSDNYGAADFAPQETAITPGLRDFSGVFFGKSSAPGADNLGVPVCSTPENHTLIIAQTGSGKGTRVIVPTLLRYTSGSMFILDPKGENAAITARARSAFNHVRIINPWGIHAALFHKLGFQADTYNPLDILDKDDPNATSIAQALAGAICPVEGGKDDFWKGSAGDLLAAVFLFLAYQPGEKKTLARAREITSMNRKRFTEILAQMISKDFFDGAIRELADQFIDMADDTYSGITTNLNRSMAFMTDPQIKRATASSMFSMKDLTGAGKDRPTSLYIVAPPGKLKTQRTWLRLLITAGINTFANKPEGEGYRCMFLMDEFANLGFLDEMPTEISYARGHGIDFTLIVQGLKQLKKTYGDADATILDNCAYKWYCNIGDLDTAKHLSETLGKKTVRTVGKSKTEGLSTGGANVREQEGKSTNYGEMGKDLISPDEALKLGKNVAFLTYPGTVPKYLRPVDYWKLPEAFDMFKNSCPKLFWDPPLFYDPNPLVSGSRGSGSPPLQQGSAYDQTLYAPKTKGEQVQPPKPSRPIDLNYYSPANSKPSQPQPSEKPEPKPSSNYDPTYYSPEKIEEREAAKKKQAAPPPVKKNKAPDGNYDLESGNFQPFKKPKEGGD